MLPAMSGSRTLSANDHTWDGVAGARGRVNLPQNFFLPLYADVGTGDSDLTWQVMAGVGYAFERIEVMATYRRLKWDFGDDFILNELKFGGPLIGFKFRVW
jgi:hypothetical protein